MNYHFHSRQRRRNGHVAVQTPQSNSRIASKSGEIDITRFINQAVSQSPQQIYQPRHTFSQFGLDSRLVANLTKRGYQHPTAIQDQGILPVMEGKDVIGLANTGTGKTAAFLLPILHHYLNGNRQATLIVVPTRELASQIYDEFRVFNSGLPIQAVVIVGGESMKRQIIALRKRPHLIIGTPGRLKDLLNQQQLDLSDCGTLVLDEVDRMLDMGFIKDIRFILAHLPAQKQSLFFSATMTRDIENLAHTLLNEPVTISVRTRETSEQVDQHIIFADSKDSKQSKLEDLLRQPGFSKVLIFGGTKWGVEKTARKLQQAGFNVAAIHGNKTQPQRQRALNEFKANKLQALVATDVAARGLDISGVTHVINFDIPNTYDEYVHRVGRTGRAGQTGQAITFVPTPADPAKLALQSDI